MEYPNTVTIADFEKILGTADFTEETKKRMGADFRYRILEGAEKEACYIRVVKELQSPTLRVSGPHRLGDWEKGWGENLEGFKKTGDYDELLPKFVRKGILRFQGNFIETSDPNFETIFVRVLRSHLFGKYFKDLESIYEFGFGAGLNMVDIQSFLPGKTLYGLDWAEASVGIAQQLSSTVNDEGRLWINITGILFDLFKPDTTLTLDKNAGVFSIGTLEQTGKNFKPFVDYLIGQKPAVVIGVETTYEVYDPTVLHDAVAIAYLEKRNYLQGYLAYLKELEASGKIEILEVRRTFGSFYHDGYTYIVWRPK